MEEEKLQFVYVIEPSRRELVTDPGAWTPEEILISEAHYAYLKSATEEGTVILAGRSLDGEGPAVVVFEAANEKEARRFVEGDPFISSGLMRGHLHPFRAALVRGP
jgi:uncharacterized protein YciI